MINKLVLLTLIINMVYWQPGYCQPARNNFGDTGAIPFPASKGESYGINSPGLNNAAVSGAKELYTRHYRWGQNTGIGASSFQTVNPTSEGGPAMSSNRYATTPAVTPTSPFTNTEAGLTFSHAMSASPKPTWRGITPKPSSAALSPVLPSETQELNPFPFLGHGKHSPLEPGNLEGFTH